MRIAISSRFHNRAVVAEWLRRWTWNPMGFPRAGSNPAGCEMFLFFCIFFCFIFEETFEFSWISHNFCANMWQSVMNSLERCHFLMQRLSPFLFLNQFSLHICNKLTILNHTINISQSDLSSSCSSSGSSHPCGDSELCRLCWALNSYNLGNVGILGMIVKSGVKWPEIPKRIRGRWEHLS